MSPRHSTAPADLRSPYRFDIHELGRRPGSMRRVTTTVPAAGDWALELVAVPAGVPVALDLRLEAVMEGVLVTGTATADVAAECGRCLEPMRTTLAAPVQELFAYQPGEAAEDDLRLVEGESIDLEPVLRDAIVLALPLNPLCAPDCAGLCPTCGERRAELPAEHAHHDTDTRWAALAALRTPEES